MLVLFDGFYFHYASVNLSVVNPKLLRWVTKAFFIVSLGVCKGAFSTTNLPATREVISRRREIILQHFRFSRRRLGFID